MDADSPCNDSVKNRLALYPVIVLLVTCIRSLLQFCICVYPLVIAWTGQKEVAQAADMGYLDDACLALESLMTVSCSELDNPKSLPALKVSENVTISYYNFSPTKLSLKQY
jgi:hypothetical protein